MECAVVSKRDKLKGEMPFGFVVVKNDMEKDIKDVIGDIKKNVVEKIGKIWKCKCMGIFH